MRRGSGRMAAAALLVLCASCTAGPPHVPLRSSPVQTAVLDSVADRAAHTATLLGDGRLLVAGGCAVDGCTAATATTVLVSRGSRDGAVVGPELLQARDAHTATRLPTGQVLVVGGFGGEGQPPLASAELFDPDVPGWTSVGALATGRGGHAAVLLGPDRVLVAGGWTGPRHYTAGVEIFDPGRRRFAPGPSLPVAVDGLAAARLPDGRVLITGGQREPGVASDQAVVVGADGRSSRQVGPLLQARFKHVMVALPSGEVLVVGGTPDDRTLLTETEIYDPTTTRFRPGPRLSSGRYKLAGSATVLPDGRVAVAGGGPGVEVIDLDRDRAEPVLAAGSEWGSFSTASVVGDRLQVIGGYDRSIRLARRNLSLPLSEL